MDVRVSEFAVAEAKAKFSELIGRAEQGEEIVIKRHGEPVAKLVPVGETENQAIERRRRARLEYETWLLEHGPTLGPGITIKELIDEGRR
jgi:prevent-host-death family protein